VYLSPFNNWDKKKSFLPYTERIFIYRILVCQLWELRIFIGKSSCWKGERKLKKLELYKLCAVSMLLGVQLRILNINIMTYQAISGTLSFIGSQDNSNMTVAYRA
jgi:hypothetical protein